MIPTPISDRLCGLARVSSSTDRDARYAKAVADVAALEREVARKTQALRRAQEAVEEGSLADEILTEALKSPPTQDSSKSDPG